MKEDALAAAAAPPAGERGLRTIGVAGAALTVAVVGASALLRLSTGFEGGEAVSRLPEAVEQGARIAHRLAAMAVGFLAAFAIYGLVRHRPAPRERVAAVAAVALLTLVLATVGRYTPGYRSAAITVVNVLGGTLLACAFAWLAAHAARQGEASRTALAALGVVLLLAALGAVMGTPPFAAASTWGPLHLGLGALALGLAFAAAWRCRARPRMAGAMALLAVAVLASGFPLVRGVAPSLATAHAVGSCVLAVLLAALAAQPGAPPQPLVPPRQ